MSKLTSQYTSLSSSKKSDSKLLLDARSTKRPTWKRFYHVSIAQELLLKNAMRVALEDLRSKIIVMLIECWKKKCVMKNAGRIFYHGTHHRSTKQNKQGCLPKLRHVQIKKKTPPENPKKYIMSILEHLNYFYFVCLAA